MPVTATATEIRDRAKGFYPTLRRTSQGWSGTRYFMVDSDDPTSSMLAIGLPAIGSAYSAQPELAGCLLTEMSLTPLGGRDDASKRGTHVVICGYNPKTQSPIDAVASDGESFLEMSSSLSQQRIRAATDLSAIPETSREANTVELVVRAYRSSLTPLSFFVPIMNTVNTNSVAVPAVRGVPGTGFTVPARQLLARTFAIRAVRDGLLEIAYTFGYGPTGAFDFVYQPENDAGVPTGAPVAKKIYPEVAYPAAGVLW